MFAFCRCFDPISVGDALIYLGGEMLEFISSPSLDEASDCAFSLGRLVGAIVGSKYVRIPGDSMTIEKMRDRMMSYQCIRSPRNIRNGRCPAE